MAGCSWLSPFLVTSQVFPALGRESQVRRLWFKAGLLGDGEHPLPSFVVWLVASIEGVTGLEKPIVLLILGDGTFAVKTLDIAEAAGGWKG